MASSRLPIQSMQRSQSIWKAAFAIVVTVTYLRRPDWNWNHRMPHPFTACNRIQTALVGFGLLLLFCFHHSMGCPFGTPGKGPAAGALSSEMSWVSSFAWLTMSVSQWTCDMQDLFKQLITYSGLKDQWRRPTIWRDFALQMVLQRLTQRLVPHCVPHRPGILSSPSCNWFGPEPGERLLKPPGQM